MCQARTEKSTTQASPQHAAADMVIGATGRDAVKRKLFNIKGGSQVKGRLG